jgi:FkbM family methyltransferase
MHRNRPDFAPCGARVTNEKQKESRKVLQNLKHYVLPENALDPRLTARLKRGAIHYAQVQSWWPVPALQRWIRRQRFEFTHQDSHGATRVKLSGADITHSWVAEEVLIDRVYGLDQVPFTPDVVLDLGANIGLFTLLAARRWPKAALVCVEPHPTTFSFLCDNLALNGVSATRLQCALDGKPGLRFMSDHEAVYQTLASGETNTRVMTLQLDALLPRDPGVRLLIKMDIEGSEVPVLNALRARLPEQCFVFIELHEGDAAVRWVRDWAEAHGFVFHETRRREDAIDGYLIRGKDSAFDAGNARARWQTPELSLAEDLATPDLFQPKV